MLRSHTVEHASSFTHAARTLAAPKSAGLVEDPRQAFRTHFCVFIAAASRPRAPMGSGSQEGVVREPARMVERS